MSARLLIARANTTSFALVTVGVLASDGLQGQEFLGKLVHYERH